MRLARPARVALPLLLAAACGADDPSDERAFTDVGGTLELPGCGYAVTTRIGAEPPRIAPDRLGPDPTPRLVHLGIVGDPRTSIVVQWRTADEETLATELRYGVGEGLAPDQLTERVTGIEFGYKATGSTIYRQHQAHACGLQPGTTYSYQVGAEGHFSPVYTFRTAPDIDASPDAEVVFGVIGDSRDGYDIWQQLAEQLAQRAPDLLLFTGDAVTIGLTQLEWEEFFGRAEPLLARVPMVFAHGNHEVNATPFYAQLAQPGDQENFAFDYGHAHVTVANDTPVDSGAITGSTRDFLASDFAASAAATWRILMHHQAIWSAATAHGSNQLLQEQWQPLIDEHALDLVIAGHDHVFELSKPMRGQEVQASPADGTVYAVVGGAGAELYEAGTEFHTAYSEKTHSAATLRVRRDLLELEAFRADGSVISAPGARFTKTR